MQYNIKGDKVSLRSYLESEGFIFPCGGKGLCGRCRIIAKELAPTEKDRRFLTEEDIARGVRLACDKVIDGSVTIECDLAKREEKAEKFERADAYAVFGDDATYIGLADGGEVLDGLILPPVEAKYAYLRGAAQKETIELFEKHSMAKADIFMLAAAPKKFGELTGIAETFEEGQSLDASLMSMPSEEVYLPPVPMALCGSDLLLECVSKEIGDFIVSGGYFAYLDERSLYFAYIRNGAANMRAATILYFMRKFSPVRAMCIGEDKLAVELGLTVTLSEIPSNAARALDSNRFKAKLDRLARKAEEVNLADDDTWQSILTEIAE